MLTYSLVIYLNLNLAKKTSYLNFPNGTKTPCCMHKTQINQNYILRTPAKWHHS